MKTRLDQLLIKRQLAQTLKLARAMIMAGEVIVNDQKVTDPSVVFQDDIEIRLKKKRKYVSRGGEKLEFAINQLELRALFKDAVVLDIGASTGGFTHCCLKFGAKKVFAVDVGTNQLAWQLRNDPKVIVFEKTNIIEIEPALLTEVNIVIADISFNSLQRLIPHIVTKVPQKGVHFLLLIKPQFELKRREIPKGGVVQDQTKRIKALELVVESLKLHGFYDYKFVDSALAGRRGNREIFVYFYSA